LGADLGDCGTHAAGVLFVAEIKKWLGNKWTGMQACARPDGGFERCHGGFLSRMNYAGMKLGLVYTPKRRGNREGEAAKPDLI
jgi:hypothetical protein